MKKLALKQLQRSAVFFCAAACLLLNGCGTVSLHGHANVDTGMARLEEGDYEGALVSFAEGLAAGENKRLIYRGRGLVYYKEGAYDEAVDAFDLALQASNGIPDAMDYDINLYIADCYMKSERYPMAASVYTTVLSLKPQDADVYYLRGVSRVRDGQTESALADFRQAFVLSPSDYDRVILAFEALKEAGEEEKGKALLAEVREGATGLSDYQKGRFAYYLGEYDDAMKLLESARAGSGAEALEAVLLLGVVAREQGDYEYAEGVYRSYLKNVRENARVYNQLGLCELSTGRLEAAISDFESGLSMDDKTMRQDLSWNMIVAYEYKGEFGTALDQLHQYLERYPTDEKALRELTFLESR